MKRSKLNRAMLDAVIIGDAVGAQALLQQGAHVEARDAEHRETALMLAALKARYKVVELLLAKGADVNAKDERGETVLSLARCASEDGKGLAPVFAMLLSCGADINAADNEGTTVLMRKIVEPAPVEVVQALLDNGADASVSSNGETALSIAISYGFTPVVDLLQCVTSD